MSSLRKLCFSLNSEDFLLYKVSHLDILHLSPQPTEVNICTDIPHFIVIHCSVLYRFHILQHRRFVTTLPFFQENLLPSNESCVRVEKKEYFQSCRSLGWEDPLEKEMATHSTFLPGESHGQRSMVDYSPWGHKESDMTEWLNKNNNNNNKKKKLCIQKFYLQCILFGGEITSRYVPPKRWTMNKKIVDPENGRSKGGGVWKESSRSQ